MEAKSKAKLALKEVKKAKLVLISSYGFGSSWKCFKTLKEPLLMVHINNLICMRVYRGPIEGQIGRNKGQKAKLDM